MEKINIAEILKDCPKGMELDCTLFDDVKFIGVEEYDKPICIKAGDIYRYLTKFGTWTFDENAKCVIYPKGKTTWEGFHRPFKDGDVIVTHTDDFAWISIFKQFSRKSCFTHIDLCINDNDLIFDTRCLCDIKEINTQRLATEEEKQKLFDAIKTKGYRWNPETTTFEKLIEPKFKVGDKVKSIFNNCQYIITELTDTHYTLVEVINKFQYTEPIIEDKNWELVPNKFDITTLKPFDKVLTRTTNSDVWGADLFGFYKDGCFLCNGHIGFRQCIPYKENERLLGTTNDCDDFYKTW